MKHYDYIITGAGAAGLSLLMRLMNNKAFDNKSILLVDKSAKNANDRTWCFWENEPGLFEPIVYSRWERVNFFSHHFSSLLELDPYEYKMIRGIDFYNYVLNEARLHPNVTISQGEVQALGNEASKAFVIVDGEKVMGEYVFNSILFSKPTIPADKYYLLQHFKGWVVETKEPFFDDNQATLMDFRVSQKHGTTFGYVLPVSPHKALVEYTLFTKKLLTAEEYNEGLKNYIRDYLKLTEYEVTEEEFGVIPMTNYNFPKGDGRIVFIGTAGGQTKPSSGYTFRFIQKHSDALIQSLQTYGHPNLTKDLVPKRFRFYDNTFLSVLYNDKLPGDKIFAEMFSKNTPDKIFRFLDNESTLEDELNILGSLPGLAFTKAALLEMFK